MINENTNISIGIRFHDNDFYVTIVNFLEGVQKHYTQGFGSVWHEDVEKNKEHIVRLFNDTALSYYITYQNCYVYSSTKEDFEHIKNYLKITKDNVLIGDEIIGEYIAKHDGWDNSEFHYFFGVTGQVNTI